MKKSFLVLVSTLLISACSSNEDNNSYYSPNEINIGAYSIIPTYCGVYNNWILTIEGYKRGNDRTQRLYFDLGMNDGTFNVGDNLALRPNFAITYAECMSQGAGGLMYAGYIYHYVSGNAILLEKYVNDYNQIDSVKVKFNNLYLTKGEPYPDNSILSYWLNDDGIFTVHKNGDTKEYKSDIPKQLTFNGEVFFNNQ